MKRIICLTFILLLIPYSYAFSIERGMFALEYANKCLSSFNDYKTPKQLYDSCQNEYNKMIKDPELKNNRKIQLEVFDKKMECKEKKKTMDWCNDVNKKLEEDRLKRCKQEGICN